MFPDDVCNQTSLSRIFRGQAINKNFFQIQGKKISWKALRCDQTTKLDLCSL